MTRASHVSTESARDFNSHPHEEDDTFGWQPGKRFIPDFNSHPHEEDDVTINAESISITDFNSHPHEEDDNMKIQIETRVNISTHILTRRMTVRRVEDRA